MAKTKLLPLSSRPTMKPLIYKKRPQSVLSAYLIPPYPPALVSKTHSSCSFEESREVSHCPSLKQVNRSSVCKDVVNDNITKGDHHFYKNQYNQSQQQISRSRHRHHPSHKRSKILPTWNVGECIESLPKVPMFHLSPPLTYLRISGNDLVLTAIDDEEEEEEEVSVVVVVDEEQMKTNTTRTERRTMITPNDIATAIVEVVTAISAIGQYNTNKACALIKTMDGTTFSISLFNIENKHHKCNKNDILIDIERKNGNTIQFHWIAKTIFNSIRQLLHQKNTLSVTPNTSPINNEESTNPTSSNSTTSKSDDYHFQNTMETICTLLKKDRVDATLLGMESLDLMTDSIGHSSSNDHIAYLTSRVVLIDDDGPWRFVRDEIIGFIDTKKNKIDYEDDAIVESNATTQFETKMKHLAFKIYANSLFIMHTSSYQGTSTNIEMSNLNEWKSLLTCLVQNMKSTTFEFCTKYQIALCIHYLMLMSNDIKSEATKLNVCDVMAPYLGDSNEDTVCDHLGLREVSSSIVKILNQHK